MVEDVIHGEGGVEGRREIQTDSYSLIRFVWHLRALYFLVYGIVLHLNAASLTRRTHQVVNYGRVYVGWLRIPIIIWLRLFVYAIWYGSSLFEAFPRPRAGCGQLLAGSWLLPLSWAAYCRAARQSKTKRNETLRAGGRPAGRGGHEQQGGRGPAEPPSDIYHAHTHTRTLTALQNSQPYHHTYPAKSIKPIDPSIAFYHTLSFPFRFSLSPSLFL